MRIVWGGAPFFVSDGKLYWQEFKEGEFRSKIRSYDFASGDKDVVVDTLDPPNTNASLRGIVGDTIIVEIIEGDVFVGQTRSFVQRGLDGSTIVIVEFANTRDKPWTFYPQLTVLGSFAVWADPYSGELVVYVTESARVRRFDTLASIDGGSDQMEGG